MVETLLNNVALVTGAGHGLGKEYARELAKQGAIVALCDNGSNDEGVGLAEIVADEIKECGGRAVYYNCSVTDYVHMRDMVEDIIEQFGRIDIVIHSAGHSISKRLNSYISHEIEEILAVHLLAAVELLKLTIPYMKRRKYGRIILVTSTVGMFGIKDNVPYATAKMGIWGLTRAVNMEVENEGILCNAIAPLAVTSEQSYTHDAEYNSSYTVQRVAPFVAALCSEKTSVGGRIYQIAGGSISRIEICVSKGELFTDKELDVSTIMERFSEIDNIESPKIISSIEQAARALFRKLKGKRRM